MLSSTNPIPNQNPANLAIPGVEKPLQLADLSDGDGEVQPTRLFTVPKKGGAQFQSPGGGIWSCDTSDTTPIKKSQPKPREDTPHPHRGAASKATGSKAMDEDDPEAGRPRRAAALNNPYIRGDLKIDSDVAKILSTSGRTAATRAAGVRQSALPFKRKSGDVNKENMPPPPIKRSRHNPTIVDIAVTNNDILVEHAADLVPAPGQMASDVHISGTETGSLRVVQRDSNATIILSDEDDADVQVTVVKPGARKRLSKKSAKDAADFEEEEDSGGEEFTAEGLKAMEDEDYSKRISRKTNPSAMLGNRVRSATDDIRTVFLHIIVDGKKQYRCLVCWNDGEPLKKNTEFAIDSPSSLRKHIAKEPRHFERYEAGCKEKGIEMHPRAIPANRDPKAMVQTSLSFPENGRLKPPPVTPEGILKHVAKLVISDDQAYLMANHPDFRQLLIYSSNGKIGEGDIPHRTTVSREINRQFFVARDRLIKKLSTVKSEISFTCDAGTTHTKEPVLAVTIHWISGTPENPNDWQLHQQCLAFHVIPGRHNAKTFSKMLLKIFQSFGIEMKIGYSVSDNAEVNTKTMKLLQGRLKLTVDRDWSGSKRRGRCSEHSLNVCARKIATTIAPTAFSRIKKSAGRRGARDEEDQADEVGGEDEDSDQDDGSPTLGVSDCEDDDPSDDEVGDEHRASEAALPTLSDDEDDVDSSGITDQGLSDGVGKALATITQINRSPNTRQFLEKQMVEVGLTPQRLQGYVPTRFASLFDCLSKFLRFKEALKRFYLLADEDDSVPPLTKGRLYASFRLSNPEWEVLALLTEVLHPLALACSSFSSDSRPALYRILPVVEFILESMEIKAVNPRFEPLHKAIKVGLDSLRKTYRQMDQTELHVMTMVLNPAIKFAYIESRWEKSYQEEAKKTVERVFDQYAEKVRAATTTPSTSTTSPSTLSAASSSSSLSSTSSASSSTRRADNNFGMAWIEAAVQKKLSAKASLSGGLRAELERYLRVGPDPNVTDVLAWWGSHQADYPILSRMVLDFLAVPASSSASERLFSAEGLIVGLRRMRMSARTLERHQFLRSSYKAGDMTTASN